VSADKVTTFEVLDGFFEAASNQSACSFSGKFKALERTDQPCPTGRADPFKIFLAKPLRRKANFELLNVPNWMQMAYFEPPKIEGITPARRGGDATAT
jgi:hypothetical protein